MKSDPLTNLCEAAIVYRSAQNAYWNAIIRHAAKMISVNEKNAKLDELEHARQRIDHAIDVYRGSK